MKLNNDEFTLSTGKSVYANCGILGICKHEDGIAISGGYDQGICSSSDKNEDFTKEERQEIAEYVIGLWKEWAE